MKLVNFHRFVLDFTDIALLLDIIVHIVIDSNFVTFLILLFAYYDLIIFINFQIKLVQLEQDI